MHKLFLGCLVLAAMVVCAAQANAQDISGRADVQRFEAYLNSNAELAAARRAHMIMVRDARHPNCDAEPTFRRVTPEAVEQFGITWAPVIGMPHLPTSATDSPTGSWGESFEANYCGEDVRENIIVNIQDANSSLRIAWHPPGHSLADITLMLDLVRQLRLQGLLMGMRAEPTCATPMNLVASVINTEVHQPQRNGGRWVEHWTLRHCGQTALMAITLTPSARGGTDYAMSELNPTRTARRAQPSPPPAPRAPTPSAAKPGVNAPARGGQNGSPGVEYTYPGDDDDDLFD